MNNKNKERVIKTQRSNKFVDTTGVTIQVHVIESNSNLNFEKLKQIQKQSLNIEKMSIIIIHNQKKMSL